MAQKKKLTLDMPLADWLERYTKEELADITQLISMEPLNSDEKKGRVVEKVDRHIRFCMDDIISLTSVFELEFLRKLLLPENRMGLVARNMDAVLPLTRTGIVISCPHPLGKDYAIYIMLDELRECMRPYVELEWQNKKQHGYDRLEQLAVGTLNLFGGMRAESLFHYIEKHISAADQKQWGSFQNYLLNNTLLASRRIFHISPEGHTDIFFGSPYIMSDTELHKMFNYAILDNRSHKYVEFPKETILKFGQMPFPCVTSPSMDSLRNMMLHKAELPFSEGETDFMLYKYWIIRMTGQTVENADIMTTLALNARPKDEDEDGKVTAALANTFRDLPQWNLDGQTTNDLLGSIERMSSDIEKNYKPKPSVQSEATRLPMMLPSTHKIGRNDPCWCGSGKKFKHCHGK